MTEGVKSAVRVVELFEYFDRVRRESSVMEIAHALDIPQSSTSALLRSKGRVGYLERNAQRKTCVPPPRLVRLMRQAIASHLGGGRAAAASPLRTGTLP